MLHTFSLLGLALWLLVALVFVGFLVVFLRR